MNNVLYFKGKFIPKEFAQNNKLKMQGIPMNRRKGKRSIDINKFAFNESNLFLLN